MARSKAKESNSVLAVLLIIAAIVIIAGLAINLYQAAQPAPSSAQGKVTVTVGTQPPVKPTTTTGLVTVNVVKK